MCLSVGDNSITSGITGDLDMQGPKVRGMLLPAGHRLNTSAFEGAESLSLASSPWVSAAGDTVQEHTEHICLSSLLDNWVGYNEPSWFLQQHLMKF